MSCLILGEVYHAIPTNSKKIYLAEYNFGQLLADDQSLYFPMNDKLVSHENLPNNIKRNFQKYGVNMPFGIVLDKSVEYFVDTEELTIPARIYHKGDCIGFDNKLGDTNLTIAPPVFHASAGTRSCFCVSNLGNATNFRSLKKLLKSKLTAPKNLYQHHQLFKLINDDILITNNWKLKILFFSDGWIDKINNDKKFLPIKLYLHQKYWEKQEVNRARASYDYISSSIFLSMTSRSPDPHIMAIVRSLILLIINAFPGYAPLMNEELLPRKQIISKLNDIYGLPSNPSLIGPVYFQETDILYYSLNYPPTMLFSKIYAQHQTTVNRLDEIREVATQFFKKLKRIPFGENSKLMTILNTLSLSYFHTHPDKFQKIESSDDLSWYDTRFRIKQGAIAMPKTSPFVRGLITLKKETI